MSNALMKEHQIRTNLDQLPGVELPVVKIDHDLNPQEKKQFRKDMSVRYASERLGFLHASLIEINGKHFLLAGPSGIGKSTYAARLEKDLGARKLVSDWIAIENVDGQFIVSDLNYPEEIKNGPGCILDGLMFLSQHDDLQRDAYSPNKHEFVSLLEEAFDTAMPVEQQVLNKFWLKNRDTLPFCCAVPARRASEVHTSQTISQILKREIKNNGRSQVGVIGLGAIGSALAFQLGLLDEVDTVHLYNRTAKKTQGAAIDMNQALIRKGHSKFSPHEVPEEVFANSSYVFMSYRDEMTPQINKLPERWRKVAAHIRIAGEYAQVASDTGFNGCVIMITNPVDFLTHSLYEQSQQTQQPLRTFQVYGAGLELDRTRVLYYAKNCNLPIDDQSLQIFGNHGEDLVIKSGLGDDVDEQLLKSVKNASPEIRQYIPRTVYGPVGAIIRTFLSIINDSPTYLTSLQEGAYIGRRIDFHNHLPQQPGETAIEEYHLILAGNKSNISNIYK